MFCENPHCMMPSQARRKFLDPRRGAGDDLVYVTKFFCSPDCEEAIVDDLERKAQYARLVS